jgi:hypothetical protein
MRVRGNYVATSWVRLGYCAFARSKHLFFVVGAVAAVLLITSSAPFLYAQTLLPDTPSAVLMAQPGEQSGSAQGSSSSRETTGVPQSHGDPPSSVNATPSDIGLKQPKRILWVIPNYRAVSADTHLPPLSLKNKFWLATQDSFDYSAFIFAGMLAGVGQAQNSYPEFRQGAVGSGRYYWHSFADQAVGNYFTEAIVPAVTGEDPRYYTLGHGGFFPRTGYAISRLLVTRTDSGGRTFNFSEVVGNGAGAGVSDLYYPNRYRTWTKTGQKWLTQIALDGVFNVFKEFWPNISHSVLRQK